MADQRIAQNFYLVDSTTPSQRAAVDSSGNIQVKVAAGSAVIGAVTQSGTWTVTANAGTNLNTSALALDTSVNGLLVVQGSTTSGQLGPLIQGSVTTSAPSYTTAKTSPISLDTSGNIRVNVTSATGSTVSSNASYNGINVAGTLRGQTGVNPSGSIYAPQIDITSVGGLTLPQDLSSNYSLPVRNLSYGSYYNFSSAVTTSGTTTTLSSLLLLNSAGNLIFDAREASISIINPSGSGQNITGVTLQFSSLNNINYVMPGTWNLAPGSAQTSVIALSSGILATVNLIVTFAGNPTASVISGFIRLSSSGGLVANNAIQLNGTTIDTNSGTKSAGTQRVVLATDQPQLTNKFLVTPDALPLHQSTNVDQWNGTTVDTNSGNKSAGTARVVLATDQPILANAQSSTASSATQTSQGITAAQILAANTSRKRFMLQNTGTTTIKIVLGSGTPTQTVYHFALNAASSADSGSGGTYIDEMWTGAVQAISSGASGTLVVTELT